MLFNSIEYFIFFISVFSVSRLLKYKYELFLLAASLFFYASWNPYYLSLILVSVFISWFSAGKIAENSAYRKLWLVTGISAVLSILLVFKYAWFTVSSFEIVAHALGMDFPSSFSVVRRIALPVGISFFTFQALSYVVDVYKNEIKHEKSLLKYALYISFFPQLVAGPIVRAGDLIPQFGKRRALTEDDFSEAVFLIAVGLVQKVVIADFLAINIVDRVFETPHMMSSLETLAGIYAYTLQIYCDFSAYSNIAIGSALLLGFKLPRNFNKPFAAHNPSDFWRRWHITLSTWLRDYLYIPLGGSKNISSWKIYRNLMITMLLGGLWHGASWNFVFWGGLHGFALSVTRFFGWNKLKAPELSLFRKLIGIFFTFNFVVFAFVFFRASSFSKATEILKHVSDAGFTAVNLPSSVVIVMFSGFILHFTPDFISEGIKNLFKRSYVPVKIIILVLFALFLQDRAVTDAVPFIYFRF